MADRIYNEMLHSYGKVTVVKTYNTQIILDKVYWVSRNGWVIKSMEPRK